MLDIRYKEVTKELSEEESMLWKWVQACSFGVNIPRSKSSLEWVSSVLEMLRSTRARDASVTSEAVQCRGNWNRWHEKNQWPDKKINSSSNTWDKKVKASTSSEEPQIRKATLRYLGFALFYKRKTQSVAYVQSFELVTSGGHRPVFHYIKCKLRNISHINMFTILMGFPQW